MKVTVRLKGGTGSGHHGHGGRIGKRGGSTSGLGVGSSTFKPRKTKGKNINTVAGWLQDKGYALGAGSTDLKTMTTSYMVTDPEGNVKKLTVAEIEKLL